MEPLPIEILSRTTRPDAVAVCCAIAETCEIAFQMCGMGGPNPKTMGKVWFAAYLACKKVRDAEGNEVKRAGSRVWEVT